MNHTETPWKKASYNLIRGPHGEPIASTSGFAYPRPSDEAIEANTNRIVKCVNEYPILIKAIRDIGVASTKEDMQKVRDIIHQTLRDLRDSEGHYE
jgi:hypothetical protein